MTPIPRSKPILYAYATIAFFNVVLGGAALADFIDPAVIGLANLIVGGAAAFLAVLQSGSNVAAGNVAVAMVDNKPVAGDGSSSDIPTGMSIGLDETMGDVLPPPPKDPASI